MKLLLYLEINIVGIILLSLLLFNMGARRKNEIPIDQQIFNGIIFANILIFVFDTGMLFANGCDYPFAHALNYISTILYYIFGALISMLWLWYTDYRLFENRVELLKRIPVYSIPALISILLILLTPFTGLFFSVGPDNTYARGPLFLVILLLFFVYPLYSIFLTLKYTEKDRMFEMKKIYSYLCIFSLAVLAVAVFQIIFFGMSIVWVFTMLAILYIYINIQNTEISTDHLTGLFNRRRYEVYLHKKIKTYTGDKLFFAILLDLNSFKDINDTYGHPVGDDVLVQISLILKTACSFKEDFIARIGGDEFIILGGRKEEQDVLMLMDQINLLVSDYNGNSGKEYTLSVSMGYSIFGKDDSVGADEFINTADAMMYENKRKFKERQKEK